MRALLATLIAVSGFLAVSATTSTADAARKHRRDPGPSYYYAPPNTYYAPPPPVVSERLACEERAQAADPTGL